MVTVFFWLSSILMHSLDKPIAVITFFIVITKSIGVGRPGVLVGQKTLFILTVKIMNSVNSQSISNTMLHKDLWVQLWEQLMWTSSKIHYYSIFPCIPQLLCINVAMPCPLCCRYPYNFLNQKSKAQMCRFKSYLLPPTYSALQNYWHPLVKISKTRCEKKIFIVYPHDLSFKIFTKI